MTAQKISQDLTRTSSLKVLSLEGNSIGNIGVEYVAKALKQPKQQQQQQQQSEKSKTTKRKNNSGSDNKCRLQALDIERVGCSMKDGVTCLALALKDNVTLESLSCGGNSGLDDETVLLDVVIDDDDDDDADYNKNKNNSRNQSPRPKTRQRHPFHELMLTNTSLRTIQPLLRFPSKIVPTIDLYLRMNRAGRKHLLMTNNNNDDDISIETTKRMTSLYRKSFITF
mmetsp:Transcript_22218/g.52269  ORF Transcript_22218/g.52269 Transcript_22218/m.52269 type:complete len:226 (-) Transcript_22218:110-787(-)